MQLTVRLKAAFDVLGVDANALPSALARPAPFAQSVPDADALARWLAERLTSEPSHVGRLAPFDPLTIRVRAELLQLLAAADPAAAARIARAVPVTGPAEATLALGTLARMSALAAARTDDASAAVLASKPLLARPRPVARMCALRLAEIGVTEGPIARRARAILEDALGAAIGAAHDLGASGALAAMLEPSAAELLLPGTADRVTAAAGRIVDLVAVLGGLAGHREGLTQRLSSLASEVPAFVGPHYVIAYLTALGEADPGPYHGEVRERLERAAWDTEPRVRALALEAIVGFVREVPAFLDRIVETTLYPDAMTRTAAAFALGELRQAPDAAAKELEDRIEIGDREEALASARALTRAGRIIPERVLAAIADPVVHAAARSLASNDDATFARLLEAYAAADPDDFEGVDARVQPMTILVDTLGSMPIERSAAWLARFAAGEVSAAAGEVLFHALDGIAEIPHMLAEAGRPLLERLERGEPESAALTAMVAARLYPTNPRLEALIFECTEGPAALVALAALDQLGEDTSEVLLAVLDDPGEQEHAELALAALARCSLGSAQAEVVVTALTGHIRDDDPLAETAHAALVELVDRGAIA